MSPKNLVFMAVMVVCCYRYVAADRSRHRKNTYIVHMDKSVMPLPFSDHLQWYETSVRSVSKSMEMLYAYNKVIHGFSTRLTIEEANLLEQQHGILSVQQEVVYELHTTRSPEFLGLERNDVDGLGSRSGSDVIVGLVDTGVWPGSKSLDDTGFGPIPIRWKGECESGTGFSTSSCNRKLIGARYLLKAYEAIYGPIDEKVESRSPMDDDGHGTHTASTAAGSSVNRASLFGFANGTARGMAPRARLAIYKACWLGGCFGSDILAAMDAAIADGIDVLSLSIGGSLSEYTHDVIAYGAFKAASNGIFVACSAGNGGPSPLSLSNVAPWITTVGAGTLDRDFPAYVTLGNGKKFSGASLYSGKPSSDAMVPLVFAGKISNTTSGNLCLPGSLPPRSVAGKIVMCERGMNSRVQKGIVVKAAGGAGMILANTETFGEELVADTHLILSVAIGHRAGDVIKSYIVSDHNPTAEITPGGTQLGIEPSPVVAAFSSRGPNPITPEILKPDFIAPGVNIIAGWTNKIGPTGLKEDPRRVDFNILSGTSMSCPHVSGLAALLKAAHPEWSPAAIRSALMTTAYRTYKNGDGLQDVATGMPSTPFDHGAGHVDPVSALDPGLVYDASADDYLGFLCALNYSSTSIRMFADKNFKCSNGKKYRVEDLNYPSFAVPFNAPTIVKYTRILTNVGTPTTYTVSISSTIRAVKITVEPETLTFIKQNEKKAYTVTFTAGSMQSGTTSFASLTWAGGKYVVNSPIAFSWV
ncbi:subtilisin-like protease SBT1.7 isoform X2 [Cynara cardunculus var. scolymus]|uniref:subtilisin-like protease SBT1.7 isoform X2 n=1 Tax=Cynara cardunculus var. scolymus TaxID=59895 RepID=UPI000D62A9E9|nr:subtilisin-like protease SBT1.7 isoform X2 [Cynara cardunculus var. scolymus]